MMVKNNQTQSVSNNTYKTRAEFVLDGIKEEILSGRLEAGQPLRQEALAEQYDVSRIPIREALLQLESQGLVKILPHKGAVVTELSVAEIDELFSLRSILEPYILAHAIPHLNDTLLSESELILDELDEALDSQKNVDQWSEMNYRFHQSLYVPANKIHCLDLIATLNLRSDRYIRIQLYYSGGINKAESEHRELVSLCREKNVDAAVNLLKCHIEDAGLAIRELIK